MPVAAWATATAAAAAISVSRAMSVRLRDMPASTGRGTRRITPASARKTSPGAKCLPRGMTSAISVPELAGPVIGPDDPQYDEARRVYFHGHDRRPAAIVRAAGVDDVARVIALARDEGLELAVRSGGHSSAGHGTTDDGVVLDLSGLTRARYRRRRPHGVGRARAHGG